MMLKSNEFSHKYHPSRVKISAIIPDGQCLIDLDLVRFCLFIQTAEIITY